MVLGLQDLEFQACSRLTTASVPTSTTAVERFPHADTEEPIETVALELPGLASHGRTAAQQAELPSSDTTTVRKYCAVLGNIIYHRVQYCIVYCILLHASRFYYYYHTKGFAESANWKSLGCAHELFSLLHTLLAAAIRRLTIAPLVVAALTVLAAAAAAAAAARVNGTNSSSSSCTRSRCCLPSCS